MLSIGKALRSQTATLTAIVDSQQATSEAHEAFKLRHELAMQEFDDKLNALIKIVGFMQGGMESQQNS